ncbi:putative nucleotidyltransferase substrate binding domain-containing protein [Corynebacterium neomassiliense]|uniref:putative nucleotidyltransferase substrate binding domain-containing protein n=1 Tax=Corynebacterium neomassiliense TaxID=2079482 RepID=UPI00103215BB|nr:putative nucleotidyltransferase substrate binding domain-containing protein [Corynebacterium neomassiliense]
MSVELDEVRRFLAGQEPFTHLPDAELRSLPSSMTMTYVRRGQTVITSGEDNDHLYIVRSGAVDVMDDSGVLLDRRGTGDSFGYSTMLPGRGEHGGNSAGSAGSAGSGPGTAVDDHGPSRYTMVAVEDSLLLVLPGEALVDLVGRHPDIARYYSGLSVRIRADSERLRSSSGADMLRRTVADLGTGSGAGTGAGARDGGRALVTVDSGVTVAVAAQTMARHGVSCLPVVVGDRLVGILTDRDLRNRVLAEGRDAATPVSEVMTPGPVTVEPHTTVFEAMLRMSDLDIHHLPVTDPEAGGAPVGMLAASDVMRTLRSDPIYLAADLSKATTAAQMRRIVKDAAQMAAGFIERGASPDEVSGLLTVGLDSLARRLLVLAEEELGPPPVAYGFAVVGSQGRRAAGFASDQDNCLVLSDDYDPDAHGDYFRSLSDRVCDGLAEAGQVRCLGDMMASNPAWRMTAGNWARTFHTWTTAPEPDAVLHAQTFYDMRVVHGSRELVESVHRSAVASAKGSGRLHAQLAALAVRREPPLGVFRGLVVRRGGDYANTLDLKKGGIAAVVQIARLYALVAGVTAVGTGQRLSAAAAAGVLSQQGARDLTDAFGVLTGLALRHQARQLRLGEPADYAVSPDSLGRIERENLRDAFGIIKSIQSSLATAYPVRST